MDSKLAKMLLEIEAVTFSTDKPFTWASGIKSPIYCDNRLVISFPSVREYVAESIVGLIRLHFPDVEIIAGTAMGGVPHAAWVAQKMKLPMIYVRSEAKTHGKMNLIEGVLPSNSKVVLIEDTVSTGKGALNAVKAIRSSKSTVLGVIAIFTYELPISERMFRENKIPFFALCNYSCVIGTAVRSNYVTAAQLEKLEKWKKDTRVCARASIMMLPILI